MRHYFYESDADELNYFNFHAAVCNCMGAHFHRSTEMLFVREGAMRVVINGVERRVTAGEFSVVNGYDVHYYESEGNSSVYVLLFGDSYLNESVFKGKSFENFPPANGKHEMIFRLLDFYYENVKEMNFLMRQGFISSVLGLVVESDGLTDRKKNEPNTFTEILSYIEAHCRDDLKLEELARRFGYTKNYFSMIFNKLTGKHFREYLNELRIEKMSKLKQENKDVTVTFAALSSGFCSLNSYYRAVKKKNRNF